VTTRGPGKIHLPSYQSNTGLPDHVGTTSTPNAGETRFLISTRTHSPDSHSCEGLVEAVWTLGDSLMRQP
ncbi:hypothetical protein DFH07DRAFT_698065, partial [Mycena maculata]